MRAFAVRKFGEAPAILDLPVPAEDGAFLIRVKFAGVNPIDYKLVDRLTASSPFPFVLGADFAGVVEAVPAGIPTFAWAIAFLEWRGRMGRMPERTAVKPGVKTEPLAHIPDGSDRRTGGCLADSWSYCAAVAGDAGSVVGAAGGGDGRDWRRGRICGADGAGAWGVCARDGARGCG